MKKMTQYSFPDNFLWGAATSATQTEGSITHDGKSDNIWDFWFKQCPDKFHDGVGPTVTSDFYQQYHNDIQLMQKLNFNSFRTSLSWSRLMPDGENINPQAVDFYNDVIDDLLLAGIEPIINLFHFDMPMHLQNKGGWENPSIIEMFSHYAQTAFKLFGDRVKRWTTFNEPIVPVEMGYLNTYHYPAVVDMKRAVTVAYHSMLASAKAIEAFKELNTDGEIGIILNLTPSYPRSERKEDQQAAHIADLFYNRSFLDPSVYGYYPKDLIDLLDQYQLLPKRVDGDEALLKANTVDFLGVNYYQPRRVKHRDEPIDETILTPESFFSYYQDPQRRMNPYRGWEIYERGLYDIAMRIKAEYNNIPWYVSENGMGVSDEERFSNDEGMIEDDYRIEFYQEHLKWLHLAIDEGANCFGFHTWTFIDNWSWLNAYKNRYGFYRLDLTTQKRSLKKSGLWYSDVAKRNGFSYDD